VEPAVFRFLRPNEPEAEPELLQDVVLTAGSTGETADGPVTWPADLMMGRDPAVPDVPVLITVDPAVPEGAPVPIIVVPAAQADVPADITVVPGAQADVPADITVAPADPEAGQAGAPVVTAVVPAAPVVVPADVPVDVPVDTAEHLPVLHRRAAARNFTKQKRHTRSIEKSRRSSISIPERSR